MGNSACPAPQAPGARGLQLLAEAAVSSAAGQRHLTLLLAAAGRKVSPAPAEAAAAAAALTTVTVTVLRRALARAEIQMRAAQRVSEADRAAALLRWKRAAAPVDAADAACTASVAVAALAAPPPRTPQQRLQLRQHLLQSAVAAAVVLVCDSAAARVRGRELRLAATTTSAAAAVALSAAVAPDADAAAWRLTDAEWQPLLPGAGPQLWAEWLWSGGSILHGLLEWQERAECLRKAIDISRTRLRDFLLGVPLQPYEYPEDTGLDMAMRCADAGCAVASALAPHVQRWTGTLRMLGTVPRIRQLAPYMIGGVALRSDVCDALVELVELLSRAELSELKPSAAEMMRGLYYLLVYRRGERGNSPNDSDLTHCDGKEVKSAPPAFLSALSRYSPLAKWVYQEPADLQRLSQPHGWVVVEAIEEKTARHPPCCLLVRPQSREAVLCVRGTKTMPDALVNCCAQPYRMRRADGSSNWAHRGMLRSAAWIWLKLWLPVTILERQGYSVRLVGHSLGASTVVMLSCMFRDHAEHRQGRGRTDGAGRPLYPCFCYSTPSCVDLRLADEAREWCLSLLNCDDPVPRARVSSLRNLLTAVGDPVLQGHAAHDLAGDTAALLGRLASAWAPRVRQPALVASAGTGREVNWEAAAAASAAQLYGLAALLQTGPRQHATRAVTNAAIADRVVVSVWTDPSSYPSDDDRPLVCHVLKRQDPAASVTSGYPSDAQLWLLQRSGADGLADGIGAPLCRGSCDTVEELLRLSPPDSSGPATAALYMTTPATTRVLPTAEMSPATGLVVVYFANPGVAPSRCGAIVGPFYYVTLGVVAGFIAARCGRNDPSAVEICHWPWEMGAAGPRRLTLGNPKVSLAAAGLRTGARVLGRDAWGARLAGGAQTRTLRSAALQGDAELFPPGRHVQLYRSRGVVRSCLLSPSAALLSRMELSVRMVSDHRMDAVFQSLRCAEAAAQPGVRPPPLWQPFDSATTCRCCGAVYTWSATSDTAAEELRSRHHCRACGFVVCGDCRTRTLALPQYGMLFPEPVCDVCYFTLPTEAWTGGSDADALDCFAVPSH